MDHCSSPKVLLLGISYPDVYGHMAEHSYNETILQEKELSVEQAVECVRRKILTEMDARDLARCVATEQAGGGHEVYTVSKEMGGIYRKDRHVYASFNNSRSMRKAMAKAFGHVRFQQVILDYYWMPTGWLVTRWAKTLFQETLPDLVKYNMLAFPGSRSRGSPKRRINNKNKNKGMSYHSKFNKKLYDTSLELEEGVVFLPFCAHVCKELVGGIDKLKPYYAITFVKKSELPGHALWKGTMAIEGDTMQHRLGKRLDQEEIYCTFQPKDIYESMEDPHVNKDEVMEMLLSIEDFEEIRMIRLRPLRQHEPPSVFKKTAVTPEKGGFIGLNREMGKKRFKEGKARRRNNPPPPLPTPKAKTKAKPPTKSKANAGRKKSIVYDSDSDVQTVVSNREDTLVYTDSDTDTDNDSYRDDNDDDESRKMDGRTHAEAKHFNPCNPEMVPQTTHYYPFPTLDLTSYMISSKIEDADRVMQFYAKQWGPKSSRKKNKRQDKSKKEYQRFRKTQQDYLSSNPRKPRSEHPEGYKWTMEGSESECSDSEGSTGEANVRRRKGKAFGGWKVTLNGDDPNAHLEPKVVERAKRDNEMRASMQLFEMKNPGFEKYSRTWANNSHYISCYKIPKANVLRKMDIAEKAEKLLENKIAEKSKFPIRDDDCESDYHENDGYVSDYHNSDGLHSISAETKESRQELHHLADVAATAPILSDDFRILCQTSQGIYEDSRSRKSCLPPFRPKSSSRYLSYNLDPHKDFPRELFRLLQDAHVDHILSWQKGGRSFVIKNRHLFEQVVLQQCCNETDATYQSFLTTIVRYGFVEIRLGKRKGGYRHNLFQQGKPKRLERLVDEGPNNLLVGGGRNKSDSIRNDVDGKSETVRDTSSRKKFVDNLYQLLRKGHSLGLDDVMHWEESGKSFRVHKLNEKFCTKVLENYLSVATYNNFKNELVDRGFKCKEGKKYGIFEHPNFVQGQRGVSKKFDDIKLNRRNSGQVSSPSNNSKIPKATSKAERVTKLDHSKREAKIQDNAKASTERNKKNNIREESASSRNVNLPKRTSQNSTNAKRKREQRYKFDFSTFRQPRSCEKELSSMLDKATVDGFSDAMRWLPTRDGFFVEPSLFAALPKTLGRIPTFVTFERNMKRLGFEVTDEGKSSKIFRHPTFFDYGTPNDGTPLPISIPSKKDSNKIKSPMSKDNNKRPKRSKHMLLQSGNDRNEVILSPKKENSYENTMATHRIKISPKSKKRTHNSISNTAKHNSKNEEVGNKNFSSNGCVESKTTLSKDSSSGPTSPSTELKKRRKVVPELEGNGERHKSNMTGKDVFLGRLECSVTLGPPLNENGGAHDPPFQGRNGASPASGRGLRSSSKVCGINPRYSVTTGNHLMANSKPRGSDRQMTVFDLPTGKVFGESGSVPNRSIRLAQEETNFIAVTSLQKMDQDILKKRLIGVCISLPSLKHLLSTFSASFGSNRADVLQSIICWYAGMSVDMEEEIETIDECIPVDKHVKDRHILHRCLLIEVCSNELTAACGAGWHSKFSYQTITYPLDPFTQAMKVQLGRDVSEICIRSFDETSFVYNKMIDVLYGYTMSELKKTQYQLEREIKDLKRWNSDNFNRELHRTHSDKINGNHSLQKTEMIQRRSYEHPTGRNRNCNGIECIPIALRNTGNENRSTNESRGYHLSGSKIPARTIPAEVPTTKNCHPNNENYSSETSMLMQQSSMHQQEPQHQHQQPTFGYERCWQR